MNLTIQISLDSTWHDAATLIIPNPELGHQGPMQLGYDMPSALDRI
ncbi:hypothetical protein [Paludibacterium purpuratum]|uniref:Uncharacterized protein n=1 Tax=Paludibacterium purpuratum TaxID=1144873 RepID=A0A4R7B0M2_9NEIS|nr:hypothetical protein [Paludibacterium purpuratum]TDR76478.1 hypothetical protein DFP86_11161 [Paludibacterium purpuratum]